MQCSGFSILPCPVNRETCSLIHIIFYLTELFTDINHIVQVGLAICSNIKFFPHKMPPLAYADSELSLFANDYILVNLL
jgi:hypothetical protein